MTDLIERLHIERPAWPDPGGELVRYSDHVEALAEKDARIAELRDLVDRLRLEAQIHAGEARGANATIHEAYQAVTEGKGEPGNWNGAIPIKEELNRLRTQLTASRAECEGLRAALTQISAGPIFVVTDREKWIEWAVETAVAAISQKEAGDAA